MRRSVFAIWIVFVIAIILAATGTGSPTSDDTTIPGSGLDRGHRPARATSCPKQANGTVPIVLEVDRGKLTEGANKTGGPRRRSTR